MKTISTTSELIRGCTGATPSAPAIPARCTSGLAGRARVAVPAAYPRPVAGALLGKQAHKRSAMARINTTGWPLGPQDRLSG